VSLIKHLGGALLIIFLILITIGGILLLKEFVIGRNADVESIGVSRVDVSDGLIEIDAIPASSMGSYKNFSYSIDGSSIYVTITSVSGISGWDGKIKISGDFSSITEIYLYDKKNKKLIWQK